MKKGPKPTWKILDRGQVHDPAPFQAPFTCMNCWAAASLPVLGHPIAQIEMGIVFDRGPHAMPKVIQCRRCRKIFDMGE